MTVVVGIQGKRGVLLAGDSQWSWDNSHRMGAAAKVHSLLDTVAIGYCGSGRFGQILQYEVPDHLEEPSLVMDEEYWAVREFIPFLRQVTLDHGHLHVHHNVEEFGPSAFLLAVRGRLFLIEADFSVNEHMLPYEAVGSGEDNAIGVFHSIFGTDEGPINDSRLEPAARKAVQAAIEFNNFVGGPISIVKTILYSDAEKALARKVLGK